MTTTRATYRFEAEVMRRRPAVIGIALAAILAGVAAFVIGLRQPIAAPSHASSSYPSAR